MGLGIAEERHHAVTEVLGNVATEARYRFSGGALIIADYFAPLFRIELSSDRSRTNQVAEQHRQMAPLTNSVWCDRRGICNSFGGSIIQSGAALAAKLFTRLGGRVALWARSGERRPATRTEFAPFLIVHAAFRAAHISGLSYASSSSSSALASFRSAVLKPSVNQP
jgi:hypothetical protein